MQPRHHLNMDLSNANDIVLEMNALTEKIVIVMLYLIHGTFIW